MIKNTHKSPWNRWFPWLILLVSILPALPSLTNGFSPRDPAVLQGFHDVGSVFSHSSEFGEDPLNEGRTYRPVSQITFILQYMVCGKNSTYFHAFSLILHAVMALLLYFLLCEFKFSIKTAFFISLLFAWHPVNSQAIFQIKAQEELLAGVFMLLSFLFFVRHLRNPQNRGFILSVCCFILAVFSKETSVIYVLVFPFLSYLVKGRWFSPALAAFIAAPVLYLVCYRLVLPHPPSLQVYENALIYTNDLQERWAMGFEFFARYLQKVFFPVNLTYDYGFKVFPIHSFGNALTICGVLLLSVCIAAAVFYRKTHPLRMAGLAFFIIGILPFIQPVYLPSGTFSEVFLYLPLVGLLLLAGDFIKEWKWMPYVAVPLIVVCGLAFFLRAPDWKSTASLTASDLKKAPASFQIHYDLATEAYEKAILIQDENQRRIALEACNMAFAETVAIYGKHPQSWYNMGLCNLALGEYSTAELHFKEVVTLQKKTPEAYVNLGNIQYLKGERESAKAYYELALKYNPDNPEALSNLGAIYLLEGKNREAYQLLTRALEIDPSNADARYNRDIAIKRGGNLP